MQTFDQALFHHVKAGRVTTEERLCGWPVARTTSKLLLQADAAAWAPRWRTSPRPRRDAMARRGPGATHSSAARCTRAECARSSRLNQPLEQGPATSPGKVTVEMAADDTCPVCRTAEVVCGKWTLLLVRDLAEGRTRFCELERSLAGISPRTLSLRLRALEEEGIVERHTFPEVPPRVEYALTEKGLALLPIIEDMRSYGERWLSSRLRRGGRLGADACRSRVSRVSRSPRTRRTSPCSDPCWAEVFPK